MYQYAASPLTNYTPTVWFYPYYEDVKYSVKTFVIKYCSVLSGDLTRMENNNNTHYQDDVSRVAVKVVSLLFLPVLCIAFSIAVRIGMGEATTLQKYTVRKMFGLYLLFLHCFSGGAVIGVILMVCIPLGNEGMRQHLSQSHDWISHFPAYSLLIGLGFFVTMIFDKMDFKTLLRKRKFRMRRVRRYLAKDAHSVDGSSSKSSVNSAELLEESPEKPDTESKIATVVMILMWGIHIMSVGMVIGLQRDLDHLIMIIFALSLHLIDVSYSVGFRLSHLYKTKPLKANTLAVAIAFLPSIGIVIGGSLTELSEDPDVIILAVLTLEGLAVGGFTYVIFLEVVHRQLMEDMGRLASRIFFIFLGFLSVVALELSHVLFEVTDYTYHTANASSPTHHDDEEKKMGVDPNYTSPITTPTPPTPVYRTTT